MRSSRSILLIEDDEVDIKNIERVFKEAEISNNLAICNNGEEALAYLEKNKVVDRPCLIMMDLNMPRMNGKEFLLELKINDHFKMIPVIVFSTSEEERDVEDCFRSGVAGYFIKPLDYTEFLKMIQAINVYWRYSEMP